MKYDMFMKTMLENVVIERLIKQFGYIDEYDIDTIHHVIPYLTKREYKRVRRGARTILGRAGLRGVLTDKELRAILSKAKIEVK